jgi:PIN domain nuclease of toxin-antitoxin system
VTFVPVDNAIALQSVRLDGGLPEDPADRIIVATATGLGARLVTKDRRLQEWAGVDAIW